MAPNWRTRQPETGLAMKTNQFELVRIACSPSSDFASPFSGKGVEIAIRSPEEEEEEGGGQGAKRYAPRVGQRWGDPCTGRLYARLLIGGICGAARKYLRAAISSISGGRFEGRMGCSSGADVTDFTTQASASASYGSNLYDRVFGVGRSYCSCGVMGAMGVFLRRSASSGARQTS